MVFQVCAGGYENDAGSFFNMNKNNLIVPGLGSLERLHADRDVGLHNK